MSDIYWKRKYEEEHRLRCDIERRFDRRFSDDDGEVGKARYKAYERQGDDARHKELRESLVKVLLHARALSSIISEIKVVPLMWLKVLRWRRLEPGKSKEELREIEEQILETVIDVFSK